MRFWKFCLKLCLWLLALAIFGLIAVFGYWLVFSQSPWAFVPDDAISVISIKEGLRNYPQAGMIYPQAGELFAVLGEIQPLMNELTGLFEQLDPEIILAINQNEEPLLIARAGLNELFSRSGFLAARSVFNPNDEIKLSLSEESTSGFDYTIYHLGIKGHRDTIALALVHNILLVAREQNLISAAVDSWKKARQDRYNWKTLIERVAGKELSLASKSPSLIPNLSYLKQIGRRISGLAWDIEHDEDSSLVKGVITFPKDSSARILYSNQYRPEIKNFLPAGVSRVACLLFDDLTEVFSLFAGTRAEERQAENELLNACLANEVSILTFHNQGYLFLSLLDPVQARKFLNLTEAESYHGWTLSDSTKLKPFEVIGRALEPGQVVNSLALNGRHLFLAQSKEVLKTLIDELRLETNSNPRQKIDPVFEKPANLIIYDRAGSVPPLPAGFLGAIRDQWGRGWVNSLSLISKDGMIRLEVRTTKESQR